MSLDGGEESIITAGGCVLWQVRRGNTSEGVSCLAKGFSILSLS